MPPVMSESSAVEAARAVLEGAPSDVMAVYLYGSRGRGTATALSDMDLGVLLREAPSSALRNSAATIEDEVERATRVPVQAVVLNTASPDLVHRVLRDGVLLLDRDRASRIRFEVQARNEYFDLAPVRRLYRRVPV
jgi:predicted nucleotidyltransferase